MLGSIQVAPVEPCVTIAIRKALMMTKLNGTRVRAPAYPGLPAATPMNDIHAYDEPTSNRQRRVGSERRNREVQPLLQCSKKINICSYNVRTLAQDYSLPELSLEATRKDICVMSIQEHRLFHEEPVKTRKISDKFTNTFVL